MIKEILLIFEKITSPSIIIRKEINISFECSIISIQQLYLSIVLAQDGQKFSLMDRKSSALDFDIHLDGKTRVLLS